MAKGENYEEFIAKFNKENPKTTDDCYTPQNIYDAVLKYVCLRWPQETQSATIVRPFYPGGDYEHEEYKSSDIVVDNPPFSIFKKILRFFYQRNIKFFLFAPSKTCIGILQEIPLTIIMSDAKITYENGANVPTAFITNLPSNNAIESSTYLHDTIKQADGENKKAMQRLKKKTYNIYPKEIITTALIQNYCGYRDFVIPRKKAKIFRSSKIKIYGGCMVVSDNELKRILLEFEFAKDEKERREKKEPTVELSKELRDAISQLNAEEDLRSRG